MADTQSRLVITSPTGEERVLALAGSQARCGRATTNDIVLQDGRVSREHARLEREDAGWVIVDLGSGNGTWVNGSAVQRAPLHPGDLIRVGDTVLRYEERAAGAVALPARIDSAADLEATLAGATLAAMLPNDSPHLAVHADGRTRTLPLLGETFSVGREPGNDLVLSQPRISRRHARIERRGDAFFLRDLGSSNGTFVGAERVTERRLQNGDAIFLGGVQLIFKAAITANDLTMVGGAARRRLRPVVIVPGLMGSQLWHGEERVWPSVKRLFTEPGLFTLPQGPALTPRGIVDDVVIVPNLLEQEQYGRLSEFLEESLGYQRGRDLLEFAYDWRLDIRDSARRLAQAIAAWNVEPPIILVGHSLGCLVSRYYIERLGGKDSVGRLLLMGGPHYGAPKMVSYLFEGVHLLPFGLMGERLRDVVSSFTTCYQILPIYPCVFDQHGQAINLLHDENWLPEKQRPLLAQAREFRQELGEGSSVPTVSIFGYGLKTLTALHVERDDKGAFRSIESVEEEGGDETVPEVSTVLAGSEIHPVEQTHGSLYVDQDVKMRLKLELLRT